MADAPAQRLRTPRAAPLATALIAALAAALLAAPASAAPAFVPATWSSYNSYTATGVPSKLLFPDDVSAHMFPLDLGYSVKESCYGPSRPAPSLQAARAPGACDYEPTGPDTWRFTQKLPSERLRLSNCYCYAVDRFEGGWCEPGKGGGMGELNPMTLSCADLSTRIVADGAVKVTAHEALSGAEPADGGHYIAALFRPQASCDFPRCGPDFHFARRDAGGRWSHKVGEAAATDRDGSGQPITNPQAAHFDGGYTDFCGFYKVVPSAMRLGVQRVPDRITNILAQWRAAGVAVSVTQLPYDPAVDFVDEAAHAKERLRMQRTQQQGGNVGGGNIGGGDSVQMLRSAPAAPTNNAAGGGGAAAGAKRAKEGGGRKLLLRGGGGPRA